MRVELDRWCSHPDVGTFGTLTVAGGFQCRTVERPWLENRPFVSCIPEGEYVLKPRRFNRGGYDTWEVCHVPGRSYILIHKAVIPEHVQGCIGVGTRVGTYKNQWAILGQSEALSVLLDVLSSGDEHTLSISRQDY